MMRILCTLSIAATLAATSAAPIAAQAGTAPAAGQTAKPAKPAAPAAKTAGGAGRTVELTGGDDMKYSTTAIQAKPGETLHIVLKSTGTVPKMAMAHNFVLLKATTKVDAFATAAMSAQATGYIPA